MQSDDSIKIPREIHSFFGNPGGHSLIVRGIAGAGKTTFALQVVEDLAAVESSYYYSTRVSDASLFLQFPWLKEKLGKEGEAKPASSNASRSALAGLKGIASNRRAEGKGIVSVSIGKELGDIEAMYEAVEKAGQRSLVVIDSIDALAERYSLSCVNLINTLQKDLVEGKSANLVFVLESPEPMLDYLGDGVVRLGLDEHEGRRTRVIDLLKLRGIEIRQPKYLYTLKGGRIQSFEYHCGKRPRSESSWAPLADKEPRVSTGIADLDALLGGGAEKGSVVLIELGNGVPTTVINAIEDALVANFVSTGRGVVWMPVRKSSAENAKARLMDFVPADKFDKLVRIPELASAMDQAAGPFVMAVEGASVAADLRWPNLSYALQGAASPWLTLMAFDALESMYGPTVMDQLTEHLAAMKRNNGVFVGVTSRSTASAQRVKDLSTAHIKLERIGGTVVLFGEEPYTECNAVIQNGGSNGGITLTPIV